jgi:hypothetical protein
MLFYPAALPLSRQILAYTAGFGVGTATAWGYVTETVALPAARSPKPRQALRDTRKAGTSTLAAAPAGTAPGTAS